MTSSEAGETPEAHARLVVAIQQLRAVHGDLADILANLTAVIAEEAVQNVGFATRLNAALTAGGVEVIAAPSRNQPAPVATSSGTVPAKARRARGRRPPGPWDPFVVYAEVGEDGLKERLSQLELEQLRDIIAEHGMNSDGLAMKWRKPDRVVSRIVERVVDRAAKGDAFRHA